VISIQLDASLFVALLVIRLRLFHLVLTYMAYVRLIRRIWLSISC